MDSRAASSFLLASGRSRVRIASVKQIRMKEESTKLTHFQLEVLEETSVPVVEAADKPEGQKPKKKAKNVRKKSPNISRLMSATSMNYRCPSAVRKILDTVRPSIDDAT